MRGELMLSTGMTQQQVADELGWSRSQVRDYANLENISPIAWKLIGATFQNIAPGDGDGAAPRFGATAPFTENLLRNILDLTEYHQVEIAEADGAVNNDTVRRSIAANAAVALPAVVTGKEHSDRQIARALGVDHKTVSSQREELQGTGEIPQLDRTMGADGKERPRSTRPRTVFVSVEAECRMGELLMQTKRESVGFGWGSPHPHAIRSLERPTAGRFTVFPKPTIQAYMERQCVASEAKERQRLAGEQYGKSHPKVVAPVQQAADEPRYERAAAAKAGKMFNIRSTMARAIIQEPPA